MTAPANVVANFMANAAMPRPTTPNSSAQTADETASTLAGSGAGASALSFAALVRQIASRSMPAQAAPELAVSTDDSAIVGAGETAVDLNALLPFLDGLGLLGKQTSTAEGDQDLPADQAESDDALLASPTALPVPDAPLAAPITAPVTIAADHPAPDSAAETSHPAISAATIPVAEETAPALPDAAPVDVAAPLADNVSVSSGSFATAAQQAINNLGAAGSTLTAPQMTITPAVGASEWGDAVGQRIVWMANHAEGRAELVLTPPQMGRVEVSVTVSGDQASASFGSANPVVREALEAALPRLRELLADAGIQLSQTQVGAENTRQSARQDKNPDNFGGQRHDLAGTTEEQGALTGIPSGTRGLKVGQGLVDVFA